jgi:hypothetical protein
MPHTQPLTQAGLQQGNQMTFTLSSKEREMISANRNNKRTLSTSSNSSSTSTSTGGAGGGSLLNSWALHTVLLAPSALLLQMFLQARMEWGWVATMTSVLPSRFSPLRYIYRLWVSLALAFWVVLYESLNLGHMVYLGSWDAISTKWAYLASSIGPGQLVWAYLLDDMDSMQGSTVLHQLRLDFSSPLKDASLDFLRMYWTSLLLLILGLAVLATRSPRDTEA